MTVIVYKCDVCNREIDLPQNSDGFEVIQRCIITQGCKGKLHVESVKRDYIRGAFPTSVAGLDDWTPRRVLYNHEQTIKSKQWQVIHNLGVKPIVQVFVNPNDNSTDLVEVTPTNITIVSLNELLIDLDESQAGTAQCVARSTANTVNEYVPPTQTITTIQLTTNAELTIATLDATATILLDLEFMAGTTYDVVTYSVDNTPSINSPWSDSNKVLIKNKIYTVRSFNINNLYIANGTFKSGTPVKINSVNEGEVLVLLAAEPYETYDKILNKYIDAANIDQTLPEMFYDKLGLYIPDTLTHDIFPPIKLV